MARLAFGAHNPEVGRLQAAINAYLAQHKHIIRVPSIGRDNQLTVDNDFGTQTEAALTAIQRYKRRTDRDFKVDGIFGPQSAGLLDPLMDDTPRSTRGLRQPQADGATSPRQQTRSQRAAAEDTTDVAAPQRSDRFDISDLGARSPNLRIPHYTQPDGSSCIPTTKRMIEDAGGHIGKHRVGNEPVRLDGALLQRLLTQLQTTGVMTGVRSREDNGAIRGGPSGHVIAVTGYEFVRNSGSVASNAAVHKAVREAGGDWNRLLGALHNNGIHLRLKTNDPGVNESRAGARSYLDVAANGLISRPKLGDRWVAMGQYTVRYFAL